LIRFGGTMEIGEVNQRINLNRVRGIIKSVPRYFPDYELETPLGSQIWSGLRPCSPDGLPYMGRSQRFKNLIVATGHSMMGLSLAPATGKIVAELVEHQSPSTDISLFDPERYQ
jgi:D-amino-acid dehydrogenase